jgi:hypothetical protein
MTKKGIIANIFRSEHANSPLNKFNKVQSVLIPGEGPFLSSDDCQEVLIVKRSIWPNEAPFIHAEPANKEPGEFFAFGGSFIYCSDSRFFENTGSRQPIPLHDRRMNLEK